MKKIIEALKAVEAVSAWKIQELKTQSTELFYVLDKLETNRATSTVDYSVTVYVDKDGMRGSSTFAVYSYMSKEELEEKVKENVFAAQFALNPFFEIPSPKEGKAIEVKTNLTDKPFNEAIEDVVNAVFKANVYKEGYLSATEFFLYKKEARIVNSKGIDVSSVSYSGNVELIPSWEANGEEVEIYHMMKFGSIDTEAITKEVDEQLKLAKARFEAKKLEVTEGVKVIIQDQEVEQLFSSFKRDLDYQMKFMHMNINELNQSVQGDDITGDKLTMTLVPSYENAMNSKAMDNDGVLLQPTVIIQDGIAIHNHGNYQFGYYLKEENPTGNFPVMVVKEGQKSFEEMAKEPYIRCVQFSGMQVEPNSGFFGGEVRLGFYFDGTKEIPVTGFSISGNLNQQKGAFVYSSDTVTLPSYHGPKYIEIKGMKIA